MANAPSKLTVEQQLLVSTVADEITETTSIHQQAIVRMLAVASEHDLNAANLLQDLGVEMKSATARKIPFVVEDLKAGLSVEAALARTPGVVPESTVMALVVAQSRGLKKPMNHALLNTTNKRESEDTSAESFDAFDRISKLVQKYIFVFCILSFLMLFIIPQFKDMFEEFGIELPASMITLIYFANFVTLYWFVFALVLMAVGGYLVLKNPRILTNYFTRWIPNRWQQPVLTKRAQKDLSAAWVIQASDDLPVTAMQFIEDNGIKAEEFNRLAGEEKSKSSTGVLEALVDKRVISKRASAVSSTASSRESAAWILRKMSKEDQSNRRQRGLTGLRTMIWMANLFAMAIGGWAAIAIFQSLLCIIQGLTGHA